MPPAKRAKSTPPPPPVSDPPEIGEDEIPDLEKRSRSPKMEKLESSVAGLYIMIGGAMSTVPEQVGGQRLQLIGVSVARSSDEIADAWMDLAEDDARVRKALESLTSFSGWGKVVGVHLMAVGTAVPGIAAAGPMFAQQQPQQQPQAQAVTGMSEAQAAMMIAEIFRQSQSQQRAEAMAAPPPGYGDAPAPPPPVQQQQQAGVRMAQPQPMQQQPVSIRAGRGAGIPSAADLFGPGATPDAAVEFPTAGPENIRG